jgi:hypothetical protein
MIDKTKCQHDWTEWVRVTYSSNHYNKESWLERLCRKCGAVEQEFDDELQPKSNGEGRR